MNYTNDCKPSANTPSTNKPPFIQRKSPRAAFHDYNNGDYFVTICTKGHKHYFGEIENGEMKLSQMGIFATNALENLPSHYKYAQVPLFVVMPNHIHAIVCIETPSKHPECMPSLRAALSVVIGGFKQSVTLFAQQHNIKFEWQSRYHDHIIRGIHDGNNISEYIQNNVARWDNDCYNNTLTKQP